MEKNILLLRLEIRQVCLFSTFLSQHCSRGLRQCSKAAGGGVLATELRPTPVTPRTVAHQASPSLGFSRQAYWSGLPFPSPGDLSHSGTEPGSPALQADSLPTEPQGNPR